jgi:diguanylate cyclase (GGDEF)-like protein
MINELGIIRGLSQRLVKLELGGISSGELITELDDTFAFCSVRFEQTPVYPLISLVQEDWNRLKLSLERYREAEESEKEALRKLLIKQSEAMWKRANATVLLGQFEAEKNRELLGFLLIFILAELLIGGSILYLMVSIVRRRLEPDALLDSLTGCYNRNVFYTELQSEISRAERYKMPLSIMEFDIDHFKKVNDTYGHDTGDRVLKELAGLVKQLLRSSDTFARTGGEEFVLLIPHTSSADAHRLAEKLRKAIEAFDFDLPEPITCSFGVSAHQQGESWQDLFSRTDELLYKAKANGRNRVERDTE